MLNSTSLRLSSARAEAVDPFSLCGPDCSEHLRGKKDAEPPDIQVAMKMVPISGFRQERFSIGADGSKANINVVSNPNTETQMEKNSVKLAEVYLVISVI